MLKCDLLSQFIEITLRHGCSPVNKLHIFRTTFFKKHLRTAASELYFYPTLIA